MESSSDRPTRILVECVALLPSVRLGVLAPLKPLAEKGLCEVQYKETAKIVAKDIEWCDILVCVRGFWIRSLRLVQAAKKFGRLVAYFLDDDLLGIPKEVPSGEYLKTRPVQKIMKEIIGLSDYVWFVNERLAEKMKHLHSGKTILSKVPTGLWSEAPETTDECQQTRILYAGSTDHKGILCEYILPALEKINARQEGIIAVDIIGPQIEKKYTFVRNLKYFDNYECYKKHISAASYQIGLAPIFIDEFYKCKYYNKFIEYSSFGIVGIYTNSEPYTQIVQDEINGYLCENSVDDWTNAIEKVLSHDETRLACAQKAQEKLVAEFSPAAVTAKLQDDFPELTSFVAPETKSLQIVGDTGVFRHYLFICRIIWAQEGIRAVPIIISKAIKLFFRKLRGEL